jgi:hypothetical protein
MNERMTSEHDDARFDRLVDGDLNAEEYRALLASLDDEPGGWRRCALAFLEAQALRQEFNAWRAGTASPPSTANQRPASSFTFAGWKLYLAMAASFLIVFGLGVFSPRWIGRDNPTGQSALESVATNEGTGESGSTFANASGIQKQPHPVGNVRLVVDSPGAGGPTTEVPIYEVSGNPAQWLRAQEPALPSELIAELERRGHKVERHQQYVPVDWEDGRQGVVPVESYRITPVKHTY